MNIDDIVLLVFGLFITVLLMPMWLALLIRLLFRKVNERKLAALTALPFTVLLCTRGHITEIMIDLERVSDVQDVISSTTVIFLFTSLFFSFFIPYLFANAGIAIADRILKRNSLHRIHTNSGTDI